jgi:hypothetical protein
MGGLVDDSGIMLEVFLVVLSGLVVIFCESDDDSLDRVFCIVGLSWLVRVVIGCVELL